MMRRLALLAAIVGSVAALSGCGKPATESDVRLSKQFEQADRLLDRGKLEQARRVMRTVQTSDPGDWKLARAVFLFWALSEHPREAAEAGLTLLDQREELVKPSRMSDKAAADIAVVLSEQFRKLDDPDGSADALGIALTLDPSNATACNNVAYDLAEAGDDLGRALALARRAVKAEPDNADFLDTLGWVLYKQGKHSEAHGYVQRAVKLAPYSAELRGHLAMVSLALGLEGPAYVEARKAVLLDATPETSRELRSKIIKPLNPPGPL